MAEQATFKFINLTPGPNLEQFANSNLGAIMRTAPYSAGCDAELQIVAGGFEAMIRIRWGIEQLHAKTHDPDVQRCLVRAFAQIRALLSAWRRDRILKSNISRAGQLGPMLKKRGKP